MSYVLRRRLHLGGMGTTQQSPKIPGEKCCLDVASRRWTQGTGIRQVFRRTLLQEQSKVELRPRQARMDERDYGSQMSHIIE
ncbi:hypothetical protein NEOLEDRAFT_666784 [Neolentinus lepideus HHB14362 ss-1]|uniref:Uncharacterized protein n=1 Tax=Neolentinus lepideus HHB14362 ss-1 TaxID=1314782 RepID=A0A165QDV5_9AGAM|nr:hypothetical protein NEOLEDRAFT_666784 [Neolentinus lepideus HHB14362 ss-1]